MAKMEFALEHVFCDYCKSDHYRILFRKADDLFKISPYEFNVVECKKCRLAYLNPRVPSSDLGMFYPPRFFLNFKRFSAEHKELYKNQLDYMVRQQATMNKILDVGCAKGDFLSYLKSRHSNAELYGCDMFSENLQCEDINFSNTDIFSANYDDDFFDTVTIWGVLEHVDNPSEHFKEINRILKPGGKLFIYVPNFDSYYIRYEMMDDIPRHIYFFTVDILKKYSRKYGLNFVDCSDYPQYSGGLFHLLFSRLLGVKYCCIKNNFQGFILKRCRDLDFLIYKLFKNTKKRSDYLLITLQKQ